MWLLDAAHCDACLSNDEVVGLARSQGTPLFVIDCDQVRRQYVLLRTALPGVNLHYAIKALPHPEVVATLRDEGSSFDVASSGEIELLRSQGVAPERALHTHPIKSELEISRSLAWGCNTFVVDNAAELQKFAPFGAVVKLVLRVSFRNPNAAFDLSKKFGCAAHEALDLLCFARRLGLRVRGLSFHVGSQCSSSGAHVQAIGACRDLILAASAAGFPPLDTLDIGGGFPISYSPEPIDIDAFCAPIRKALATLPRGMRLLAEPGRFIVGPAAHSVASVVGRSEREGSLWYYLDDGVYGSYSGRLFDHAGYPISVLASVARPLRASCLAGPTCDSVDVIAENILLPELELGDLVVGHTMGAYTSATASEFNSFEKAKVFVLNAPSAVVGEGATTHTRMLAVRKAE
ncbi:MAG TPA: type III PLP-dependent enzyme [Polyangiaceae bacterium]|nr:type III PLP-dependent enzyme [Polyangiaceae bacterium]